MKERSLFEMELEAPSNPAFAPGRTGVASATEGHWREKMKWRALFEMRSAPESHSLGRGQRDDVAGVASGASSIHQAHGSIAVASRGRGAARSHGTGLDGSLLGWLQVQAEVRPPAARSGARERVRSEHGLGGSRRKERRRRAPWGAPLLHASLALFSFACTTTSATSSIEAAPQTPLRATSMDTTCSTTNDESPRVPSATAVPLPREVGHPRT